MVKFQLFSGHNFMDSSFLFRSVLDPYRKICLIYPAGHNSGSYGYVASFPWFAALFAGALLIPWIIWDTLSSESAPLDRDLAVSRQILHDFGMAWRPGARRVRVVQFIEDDGFSPSVENLLNGDLAGQHWHRVAHSVEWQARPSVIMFSMYAGWSSRITWGLKVFLPTAWHDSNSLQRLRECTTNQTT